MKIYPSAIACALLLGGSPIAMAQQQKSQDRIDTQSSERGTPDRPGRSEQRGAAAPSADRPDGRESRQNRPEARKKSSNDKQNTAEQGDSRQPAAKQGGSEQRSEPKSNRADRGDRPGEKRTESQPRNEAGDQNKQVKNPQSRPDDKKEASRSKSSDQATKGEMTRDSKKSAGGKNASNDAPKWSDTQQRRVQEAFQRNRTKIKRQTNVNIEISIGRRAPRTWAYYAVPTFVVEIAPRYRGYRYAWVDDRYVIVHPKTFEIVAYIDAGSGRIYANSMRDACTTVSLSPNERERIVAAIDVRDRHDIEGVRVGFDLPDRITLQTFPSEVRRDFDGFANCRFVALSNDRIAVVAPSSREIVAILQR